MFVELDGDRLRDEVGLDWSSIVLGGNAETSLGTPIISTSSESESESSPPNENADAGF